MALGTSCEKQHGRIFALSLSTKSLKDRQFRISPPNEEDNDIENVQSTRPMLFSKYLAQSRESAGSGDFSSLFASGVQTGQPEYVG